VLLGDALGVGEVTDARRKETRAVAVVVEGEGLGDGDAVAWFKIFAIVVEVAFASVTL
jgi:hypothetical protein